MNGTECEAALAKMQAAMLDERGDLRPIDRIEFEVLDGGGVRWSLWQGAQLLYSAPGRATDVHGFLCASKQILEMRAEDDAAQTVRERERDAMTPHKNVVIRQSEPGKSIYYLSLSGWWCIDPADERVALLTESEALRWIEQHAGDQTAGQRWEVIADRGEPTEEVLCTLDSHAITDHRQLTTDHRGQHGR